jgi:hypothetical protein
MRGAIVVAIATLPAPAEADSTEIYASLRLGIPL